MHTKDISAKISCQGNQSRGFTRARTSTQAIQSRRTTVLASSCSDSFELDSVIASFLIFHSWQWRVKSQCWTMSSASCLTTKHCTPNSTDAPGTNSEEDEYVTGFHAATDSFPIAIAVLIIVVNCWVIALVVMRRNLRTVTNYILTSLAISDLCTGAISIPLFISCNIIRETGICVAAVIAMRFTSFSTVLHILTMTMDRYICIVFALRYMSWVTKRRGFQVLTLIWLFSLLLALVQLSWTDFSEDVEDDYSEESEKMIIIYDIFCSIAFTAIPVAFIAFTYGQILYEVHRQSKNIQQHNTPGWQETRRSTKQEWKVATIFVIMLLVYIVCWVPFYLLRIEFLLGNDFFELNLSDLAILLFHWLRFCSSLINPCLYILAKPDFRKALGFRRRHRHYDSELTRITQTKSSTTAV